MSSSNSEAQNIRSSGISSREFFTTRSQPDSGIDQDTVRFQEIKFFYDNIYIIFWKKQEIFLGFIELISEWISSISGGQHSTEEQIDSTTLSWSLKVQNNENS